MELDKQQRQLLKLLPKTDRIMDLLLREEEMEAVPKSVWLPAIRKTLEACRTRILAGKAKGEEEISEPAVLGGVRAMIADAMRPNLVPLVNATGVVVHTNLGRSLLPAAAMERIQAVADTYSNLEFDIASGKRGLRYSAVEELICEISGAEAALAVNNNAGAVLLALETLARGREVIVSRGELVEIGGSFRVPDVMTKSGCILKEVGTTNRTHRRDYDGAINENTGLLLKVHTSNYSLVGFTAEVSLSEMAELGKEHGLPVMEDLGSGTFVDFARYGLTHEPTVQASVAAGVDVITFSGDKLLGGPQAGIIVGKRQYIDRIKKNPLTRALRIDKLTLAALEGTLRLYRDERKAVEEIPTLRMMTLPYEEIAKRAEALREILEGLGHPNLTVTAMDLSSKAGGGSLPLLTLPSRGLGLRVEGMSASRLERRLRLRERPVIGRIEEETFIMDLRTVRDQDLAVIADAVDGILREGS